MKTKNIIITTTIVSVLILTSAWLGNFIKNKYKTASDLKENFEPIHKGEYLKTYICDENNPFEKPKTDTIIILDIKNGYIKWTFKKYKDDTTFFLSNTEKYLLKQIKKIK